MAYPIIASILVLWLFVLHQSVKKEKYRNRITLAYLDAIIKLNVKNKLWKYEDYLNQVKMSFENDFWATRWVEFAKSNRYVFVDEKYSNDGFINHIYALHNKVFKEYYCEINGVKGEDINEEKGENLIYEDLISNKIKHLTKVVPKNPLNLLTNISEDKKKEIIRKFKITQYE